MSSSGIHISDPDLEPLRPVLQAWIDSVQQYNKLFKGNDLPYWYNERANVSVLAGAAWKAGFVALEEYQTQKTSLPAKEPMAVESETPEQPIEGRNDLYIGDQMHEWVIEAKVAYPDLCNAAVRDPHLHQQMKAAIQCARQLNEDGMHLAALFVAPSNPNQSASAQAIDAYLHTAPQQLQAKLQTTTGQALQLGAHAWVACDAAKESFIEKREKKFYYPVVSLFLTVVRKPVPAQTTL